MKILKNLDVAKIITKNEVALKKLSKLFFNILSQQGEVIDLGKCSKMLQSA